MRGPRTAIILTEFVVESAPVPELEPGALFALVAGLTGFAWLVARGPARARGQRGTGGEMSPPAH